MEPMIFVIFVFAMIALAMWDSNNKAKAPKLQPEVCDPALSRLPLLKGETFYVVMNRDDRSVHRYRMGPNLSSGGAPVLHCTLAEAHGIAQKLNQEYDVAFMWMPMIVDIAIRNYDTPKDESHDQQRAT